METFLLAEGVLTPVCSKSHISYTFNLSDKVDSLQIHFTYEPKKLENLEKSRELICQGINSFAQCDQEKLMNEWETFLPVQNLLTISVDDSEEFRGCVHRQSPEQHLFISEESASPGLIPGKIIRGQWRVTISVHAVVTDVCKYKLHVLGGEEG